MKVTALVTAEIHEVFQESTHETHSVQGLKDLKMVLIDGGEDLQVGDTVELIDEAKYDTLAAIALEVCAMYFGTHDNPTKKAYHELMEQLLALCSKDAEGK